MGLHICPVDFGGSSRAALVDSVREVPIALPLFDTDDDAAAFLDFAEEMGFAPSRMSPDSLGRLFLAWMASREVDREEARCG